LEIIRDDGEVNAELRLNNVAVSTNGTLNVDPTQIYLNGSSLTATEVFFLTFIETQIYGLPVGTGGATRRSSLSFDELTFTALSLVDVDIDVTVATTHLLSNYWIPGWMSVNASSQATFGGKFTLVGDTLRSYTEPEPFARFPIVLSNLPIAGDFTDGVFTSGGYDYLMVSRNSGRQLWAYLTAFYPAARVSDTGNYIILKFPRETNSPLTNSDCSGLFTSDTVAKFNAADLRCVWIRPDEPHVFSSTLIVNDLINFIPNIITDALNSTYTVDGTIAVRVRTPQRPPFPVPVLNVPAISEDCSDLVLDATATYNGGVFPMMFNWTLLSPSVPALAAFLQGTTASRVVIPATQIPAGDYRFQVRTS
jgi:hypothetical protein